MKKAHYVKSGNMKVGQMYVFNKLAGSGYLDGVKGSCSKYCNGSCYNTEDPKKSLCYVFKSYVQYGWEKGTVVQSHIGNTLAIRTDMEQAFKDLNSEIDRARKKPNAIRIHASGELESAKELLMHMEIARKHPDIDVYIYTKAYDIVDEALEGLEDIPKNFYINISIWHDQGIDCFNKWKHLDSVKAFVYADGYEYPMVFNDWCPAYREVTTTNKKGVTTTKVKLYHDITCDKCRKCLSPNHKIVVCKAH